MVSKIGVCGCVLTLSLASTTGCKSKADGAAADAGVGGFDVVSRRDVRRLELDLKAVKAATPGAWAEYDVTFTAGAPPMSFRVTMIDRSTSALDLEIASTLNGQDRAIVEHVFYAPASLDRWRADRATMRLAGGVDGPVPANELSASASGVHSMAAFVGTESISTAVGTLQTKHFHGSGAFSGDLWMSDAVTPIGMVKRTTSTAQLILRATGG